MKTYNLDNDLQDLDKTSAWTAIITGLAASGELSPEKLADMGGDDRVRTLCVHAANLALNFHAEFVRVNAKPDKD
jgi:hypothetical protein